MVILDTNVLSALMRRVPDKPVIDWLDKQPATSVWTTSLTILEIRFGLQTMPLGHRRTVLVRAFETVLADKIGGGLLRSIRLPPNKRRISWPLDTREGTPVS